MYIYYVAIGIWLIKLGVKNLKKNLITAPDNNATVNTIDTIS